MRNKIYDILLITKEEVTILASISSKGLTYEFSQQLKELYKNIGEIKVVETRKKEKKISRVQYEMNGRKFK